MKAFLDDGKLILDAGRLGPTLEIPMEAISEWALDINDHGEANIFFSGGGYTQAFPIPDMKEIELALLIETIKKLVAMNPTITISPDQMLVRKIKKMAINLDAFIYLAMLSK